MCQCFSIYILYSLLYFLMYTQTIFSFSLSLSTCPPPSMISIYLSIRLSIYLSIYIWYNIYIYICVCVCTCACVCVYVCVSMSPYVERERYYKLIKTYLFLFLAITRHSTTYSTIMAKSKKDRKAVLSTITHLKKWNENK